MASSSGHLKEEKSVFSERRKKYASQPMPKSWPPPHDFPVAIDSDGYAVAVYGQMCWDLSSIAGVSLKINFEPHILVPKNRVRAAQFNVDILKQIALRYLLGGHSFSYSRQVCYDLKGFFLICSNSGVLVTEIARFPKVLDAYKGALRKSSQESRFQLFTRLLYRSEEFGFILLPFGELSRWAESLPSFPDKQTAYIPPRIWQYQVQRLNEFVEDFEGIKKGLVSCFRYCYRQERRFAGEKESVRYEKYGGTFVAVAKHFGIFDILDKWVSPQKYGHDIRTLGEYFTLSSYVGVGIILNFSLMRIADAWTLRCKCLRTEKDEKLGTVYLLYGRAVKGGGDNVCWPTSPVVDKALRMNEVVARLRMICAKQLKIEGKSENYRNPFIAVRSYEPWSTITGNQVSIALDIRFNPTPYSELVKSFCRLFDTERLRVTQDDWNVAAAITPNLDRAKFGPGRIWPLAWHQLRRTGAVNMLSSGVVSEDTLQYLLKHAKRAMSLYYGSGFSKLKLHKNAEALYVRTMFEMLGREFAALMSERFVSPHGDMRKQQILNLVTTEESDQLEALARKGEIFYRRILLGACTRREGPCSYGGIDNVVRCAGGDGEVPCAHPLYDRKRKPQVIEFREVIKARLEDAEEGSPDEDALKAQLKAANFALKVINGKPK